MKNTILFAWLSLCLAAGGADFDLVKNGRAVSAIVVDQRFDATAAQSALELADYLEKITGARPEIRRTPAKGLYNIFLYTWGWQANQSKLFKEMDWAGRFGKDVDQVKDDGYLISVSDDGLYLIGKEPIAVYYGVCDLLRDCGEVRWFFPGEDGEYCPKAPSFSVPAQRRICNPDFKKRNFSIAYAGVNLEPTVLWMLRNKMTPGRSYFNAMGSGRSLGGHIFSTLLPDTLYDEHPEYFCMDKDGKRIPQNGKVKKDPGKPRPLGGQANQPCTSNPEVVDIMCRNVVKMIGQADNVKSFTVLNNDSTAWCHCANCKKLDPEAEKKQNYVSTRFWLLNNELIKAIKTDFPKVEVCSSAYQNYQEFPKGVVPDPRCVILLWMHSRCYAHALSDEGCFVNARFRRIIKEWSDAKMPVYPANYTDCQPGGTYLYQPLENVLAKDNQYYKKMNCVGSTDFVAPKDAVFVKAYENPRHLMMWRANFMNYYVDAAMKWDSTLDYSRIVDDIGAKFYGKAWKQMRAYRELLRTLYENANYHLCYGTSGMMQGKALQYPNAKKDLHAVLDAAEKAAEGDEALMAKIRLEREFLEKSWEECHAQWQLNGRKSEVSAGHREWRFADWESGFVLAGGADKEADNQTSVSFMYDDANDLHIRFRAEEVLKNDALTFIFANMSFAVKPNGKVSDEKVQCKVNRESDYWEGAITLRLEKQPRVGEFIKVGVLRSNKKETSSWNHGETNAPSIFRRLYFGTGSGMRPILPNGDFENLQELKEASKEVQWKNNRAPEDWSFRGAYELVQAPFDAPSGRCFVRGQGFGFIYVNGLNGPQHTYFGAIPFSGKLKVSAQFRGKGYIKMLFNAGRIADNYQQNIDTAGKWQEVSWTADFKDSAPTGILLYIYTQQSVMDFDDVKIEVVE